MNTDISKAFAGKSGDEIKAMIADFDKIGGIITDQMGDFSSIDPSYCAMAGYFPDPSNRGGYKPEKWPLWAMRLLAEAAIDQVLDVRHMPMPAAGGANAARIERRPSRAIDTTGQIQPAMDDPWAAWELPQTNII